VLLVALLLGSCGGGPGPLAPPMSDDTAVPLEPDEVAAIMQLAGQALPDDMVIAVADRRGVLLGVATKGFTLDYRASCAAAAPGQCPAAQPASSNDCATADLAVQLARTAAFFGADQSPLSSRSIRFLSGEHFPPGIRNTAAAALFGIENTNRGCLFDAALPDGADYLPGQAVPPARNLASVLRQLDGADPLECESADGPFARCGCTQGIATLPGAVPIYRNGRMAGGIGVALRDVALEPDPVASFDNPDLLRKSDSNPAFGRAEYAARAFAGDGLAIATIAPKGLRNVCDPASPVARPACCTAPEPCTLGILPVEDAQPFPLVIFVDGIEIPFVALNPSVPAPGAVAPLSFIVEPGETAAATVPFEWLVGPLPSTAGAVPLSAADVEAIVQEAIADAERIRAAIRLPLQARTAMVIAVADSNGALVGLYRMADATVFSIDVAVAKSRNVLYFSNTAIEPIDALDCPGTGDCRGAAFPPGTALTNRTLSFGAQPFFPSGIEGSLSGFPVPFAPGPFRRLFIDDSLTPCTNGGEPTNGRQGGIVFFPGSAPLYRDGILAGGLGVSGDGVEQDDIVSAAGAAAAPGYDPPAAIRADQVFVRGVRLPYWKFNRRPEQ
jgi:uncharacterized protein GlcG (DUF336 family)